MLKGEASESALEEELEGDASGGDDNPMGAFPEPMPLVAKKQTPAVFPIESLGDVLGSAAQALAECVQCSKGIAGQSILSAAALAAQPHADVVMDGRDTPLSLFCLTVAESGDRKSAADRWALKAHKDYQRELCKEYTEEMYSFEAEDAAYKKEREKIAKNNKLSQSETAQALKNLVPPKPPLVPALICQEPTLEGLQKSFSAGRPSQGLFNDEGAQVFGGHAMSRDNAAKSIAGLSKFWDGAEIIRTRAAQGESVTLFGKRLTAHLMVQPVIAESVLSDPLFQGQGFLARFLISWPDSIAGSRLYLAENVAERKELIEYWEVMKFLLELNLPANAEGQLVPKEIELTVEAKSLWVSFYNETESQLAIDGKFTSIKASASKAAECLLRVSGVLAVVEAAGKPECVEACHVRNATALMTYYLNEGKRLQGRAKVEKKYLDAKLVIDWLHKTGKETVALKDLYQGVPDRSLRPVGIMRKIVLTLAEHHWLVPIEGGFERKGIWHKECWAVRTA